MKKSFFFQLFLCLLTYCPMGFADQTDPIKGTFRNEKWRNAHQYWGRNAGGWRHGTWQGGVETDNRSIRGDPLFIPYNVSHQAFGITEQTSEYDEDLQDDIAPE